MEGTLIATETAQRESHGQILAELQSRCNEGLYRQALDYGEAHWGNFRRWPGVDARLLAAKILLQLGMHRAATALVFRLWRQAAELPSVKYAFVRAVYNHRGPLEAMGWFERFGESLSEDTELQARWLALRAMIFIAYRDWPQAAAWLQRAAEVHGEDGLREYAPERAILLERQDRYQEAIDELVSNSNPVEDNFVAQRLGNLYVLNGEPEKAEAALRRAFERIESVNLGMQLYNLYLDMELLPRAEECLRRVQDLLPAAEQGVDQAIAAAQAEYLYRLGLYDETLEALKQLRVPFFKSVCENMQRQRASGERRQLDVPFIRQHHMTCAPATFTAVIRYYGEQVDHLELVEQICYDGTPALAERQWLEQNGWRAREFELNLDNIKALIDADFPVCLATVEPGSAHMQAIIGYDTFKGIYLLRDPFMPRVQEMLIEGAHEYYASSGPMCLVFCRPERAEELESHNLRAAGLYDVYYQLQAALEDNQRERALECMRTLEQEAPGHRLCLWARRSLSGYDNDQVALLEHTEALIGKYPTDLNLLTAKASLLSSLGRSRERREFLQACLDKGIQHPHLLQALVDELRVDHRNYAVCQRLLRRQILRWAPTNAQALWSLAGLYWDRHDYARAFDFYRMCINLEDKKEFYADSYFKAARFLRRTEEALNFLMERYRLLGARSSGPGLTLVWALEMLNRSQDAIEQLQGALAQHPDDSWLISEALNFYLGCGELARAEALLAETGHRLPEMVKLEKQARIAGYCGDLEEEKSLYQALLNQYPRHHAARVRIAELIHQQESAQAALNFIDIELARSPHDRRLLSVKLNYVGRLPLTQRRALVPQMLSSMENDTNAIVAMARVYRDEGAPQAALPLLEQAVAMAPEDTWLSLHLGDTRQESGDAQGARQAYMRAIEVSVDTEGAFERLLSTEVSAEDKRQTLRFIYQQLMQQVSFGNGILEYLPLARRYSSDTDVGMFLRQAVELRPDLWQSWVALGIFQRDLAQLEQAGETLAQAVAQFPLLPRVWLERAELRRLKGELLGAEEDLRMALSLSPRYQLAISKLADVLELRGEYQSALLVITHALRSMPHDAPLLGYKADLQWRTQYRADAIATMRVAIEHNPWYGWGWERYAEWTRLQGQPEAALELARALLEQRPENPSFWKRCADLASEFDQQTHFLEHAISLAPDNADYLLARCRLLLNHGVYAGVFELIEQHYHERPKPSEVKAFEAWLHYRGGRHDLAIEIIEQLTKDDPGHYNAWRLLGFWYENAGREEESLSCARMCAHLAPNASEPYVIAAERLLKYAREEKAEAYVAEAKGQLRRALLVDYSDTYTFLTLADLYLDTGDIAGCEELFQNILADARNPYVRARRLRLSLLKDQVGVALADYSELLRGVESNSWLLLEPYKWFKQTGHHKEVLACIEASVANGQSADFAGCVWITTLLERGLAARELLILLQQAQRKREGLLYQALAQAISYEHLPAGVMQLINQNFHQGLMRHTVTWGALINRHAQQGNWTTVNSLAGQRWKRTDATASTLYYCAIGQMMVGNWALAAEMVELGFAQPKDHCRENIVLQKQLMQWMFEPNLFNPNALETIDPRELTAAELCMRDLLRLAHQVENSSPSYDATRLQSGMGVLKAEHAPQMPSMLIRQLRKQIGRKLAERVRGGAIKRRVQGLKLRWAL